MCVEKDMPRGSQQGGPGLAKEVYRAPQQQMMTHAWGKRERQRRQQIGRREMALDWATANHPAIVGCFAQFAGKMAPRNGTSIGCISSLLYFPLILHVSLHTRVKTLSFNTHTAKDNKLLAKLKAKRGSSAEKKGSLPSAKSAWQWWTPGWRPSQTLSGVTQALLHCNLPWPPPEQQRKVVLDATHRMFKKRSFKKSGRWYVPRAPSYVRFCLWNRTGTPQRTLTWRKDFSQGTRPMLPGTSLSSCRTHKGYPRNFDVKRLIQNTLSERPNTDCQFTAKVVSLLYPIITQTNSLTFFHSNCLSITQAHSEKMPQSRNLKTAPS